MPGAHCQTKTKERLSERSSCACVLVLFTYNHAVSQHLKEGVMNSVISATILCFVFGTGAVYAQASAAPATPGIPATAAVPTA